MIITEIEDRITDIIHHDNHDEFIYDFLSIYDFPKATITKLRKGTNNLAKESGAVYLKNRLYYHQVVNDGQLMQRFVELKQKVNELNVKPRYIMVTDFESVLAEDTKTGDTLDVEFERLPQKFEFFLAWNGIEKADFDKENPADIRAAERFAKLYDVVIKDNPDVSRHGLNLFLIRILFCLFAEDTDIFQKNIFTNRIKALTKEDGLDLDKFFQDLFGVLDVNKDNRPSDTPSWLDDFPYVNGDLFKEQHESLKFTTLSRKLIIDAGEKLEWDQINPDILGSMIQAVASEESRSHLGMHYTSVPNIMKVIKPLFLDELRQSFEEAKGHPAKLERLYDRIGKIKFMDPACGSGNFLIITYKELRQLEIDILKEQNSMGHATMYVPSVTLDQFYGIEIDDFATDVTRLSLWIAEHQMNKILEHEINNAVRPTLPLQHTGAIVCDNALRTDWDKVLPHEKDDEIYLFGNPPYLGYSLQTKSQKDDMQRVFGNELNYKRLDYISAWFFKGAEFIKDINGALSFVTTNSLTQGEQVAKFWPYIIDKCSINFAYPSIIWKNNAAHNAAVVVSIIGLVPKDKNNLSKKIYTENNLVKQVKNINPYLVDAPNIIVYSQKLSLFKLPKITNGNRPVDGGHLILDKEQRDYLVNNYPITKTICKQMLGASELLKSKKRYVLWMPSMKTYKIVSDIPFIADRVKQVKSFREQGGSSAQSVVDEPWSFFLKKEYIDSLKKFHLNTDHTRQMLSIIIPRHSSGKRYYIPMGIVDESKLISDSANAIYNAPLWLLGILESKMHMTWVNAIGGKLKNDYRYSGNLIYNTFPVPELSTRRKNEIEELVWKILDIRDEEGSTLSDLYGSPLAEKNPKPMNERLLAAHQELDRVVDRAYRDRPFKDDDERLALLLDMYSQKIGEEDE